MGPRGQREVIGVRTGAVRADGRKIRRIREQKGLVQSAVAKQAGITHATLSRIETGHPASLRTLEKIASVLGVEAGELQRGLEPDWLTALADIVQARTRRLEEAAASGTVSVEAAKSAADLGEDVSGYVHERAGSVEGPGYARLIEALEELKHSVDDGYDKAISRLIGREAEVKILPEKRTGRPRKGDGEQRSA